MIRVIFVWGAIIAIAGFVITQPAEAANIILTIVSGIVTFFRLLFEGIMNVLTGL